MTDWRPTASLSALRRRAELNHAIRAFFAARGVLEVETPLLMTAVAAEAHLQNFAVGDKALQTSPESAMKRLVCAYQQSIYQLGKAFRADEVGRKHNPEFTMLEWYRPDLSFAEIVDETLALIALAIPYRSVQKVRYQDVFFHVTGLNPHTCSTDALAHYAQSHIDADLEAMTRSDWLDLIMSMMVEPTFDPDMLTVVIDFPAVQAALAKCMTTPEATVAKRFEIYSGGLELANGYDEECDPDVLKGILATTDIALLRAFQATAITACTGVALGVDRLLMLATASASIAEVVSFDYQAV